MRLGAWAAPCLRHCTEERIGKKSPTALELCPHSCFLPRLQCGKILAEATETRPHCPRLPLERAICTNSLDHEEPLRYFQSRVAVLP